MTETGKYRAAGALLKAKTEGNRYFPRVWVVRDSVFFTKNAARRAEQFEQERMEELTIQEAYMLLYGTKMPPQEIIEKVNTKYDQSGALYNGNLYSPIQYVPTYKRKEFTN